MRSMQVFLTIASWLLRRCFPNLMTSVHSRRHYMLMVKILTLRNTSSIISPTPNLLNGGASLLTIWNGNTLTHSVGCKKSASSLFWRSCLKSIGLISTRKLWRGLLITSFISCGWWSSAQNHYLWSSLITTLRYWQRNYHQNARETLAIKERDAALPHGWSDTLKVN